MDTRNEAWFRQRLQQFLRERHPQRTFSEETLCRRSRLAALHYADVVANNGNAEQALRNADKLLFHGLLFSAYDIIHLILETDFPSIAKNRRRDVTLKLLHVCHPIFLLYNLGDDFAEQQSCKELRADLRTSIRFWIEENDVSEYCADKTQQ